MSSSKSASAKRRGRKGKKSGGNASLTSGGGRSASMTLIVEPWMPVFPASIKKRLRYSTTFNLSSVSGAVASYVFRANDLFDPDFTGTGHQPMGFDQLMVWYNHFCVVESRIIAIFRNTSANTCTCCVRVDGASAPITVIDRIIEIGGCAIDDLGITGSSSDMKELRLNANIPKLQGVSLSAITSDPALRGDAATSPTEVTYFHVHLWNSVAVSVGAQVDIILEQYAYFMEPRDMTESLRTPDASPEDTEDYFGINTGEKQTIPLPSDLPSLPRICTKYSERPPTEIRNPGQRGYPGLGWNYASNHRRRAVPSLPAPDGERKM